MRWFPELILAELHPVPLHVGLSALSLQEVMLCEEVDVAGLPHDSSETSSGLLAALQALVALLQPWAVQLAGCAGALCATLEHSPPQPLCLAAFGPRCALGLELGLFPMLVPLGMPRDKEWSLGGLHHGHLWCHLCSHQAVGALAPWVSQACLDVDKEMAFLK